MLVRDGAGFNDERGDPMGGPLLLVLYLLFVVLVAIPSGVAAALSSYGRRRRRLGIVVGTVGGMFAAGAGSEYLYQGLYLHLWPVTYSPNNGWGSIPHYSAPAQSFVGWAVPLLCDVIGAWVIARFVAGPREPSPSG